ncbi:DUF5919 domain-containing protein [Nocardia sp. CNY236]|uniref:DUF5919 domain-containing protein n=1 Tax=Nocardia sp. CNY236 TaxID=1169152 RepID=UPI000686471B|nr:DUF5919 domain-containing protein [Nocardia sp. CNY236]
MSTVLKALLQQRHLQTVSAFNKEYDRLARRVDPDLVGCGPKKAQFYRWLSGTITGLPYPHHCQILQAMFPDRSVQELFAPHTGSIEDLGSEPRLQAQAGHPTCSHRTADVEAVYTDRTIFVHAMPPQAMFSSARSIDLVGISLNILCQQYSDKDIFRLLKSGTAIRCLFLDPAGGSIEHREQEEGHPPGTLSSLTELNIRALQRVQRQAMLETTGSIQIRIYDEPVRFNVTIVDDQLCVMQPYLPRARGVESPAFVARRSSNEGIFNTFKSVFDSMWASGIEADQ